ncbi:MAG: TonB-dependent receptor [Flavobacteriaceae bacterium]
MDKNLRAALLSLFVGLVPIEETLGAGIQIDSVLQDTTVILMKGVTVTAKRKKSVIFDGTAAVSILDKQELFYQAPMSMPNALMSAAGVWMQRTNLGGGSPYIRGLTGYQTLLLIDGVRFNNSTFRSGPNQYLNTIDPLMVDRIEVVRGQGSVEYGSDAIGGVIQMLSHNPQFSSGDVVWDGYVYGKYLGHDMEKTGRISLDVGMKNTAISAGFTSKNLGDIVAGGSIGKLNSTGYNEYSVDFKLLQRTKGGQLFTVAYQHHLQNDVPLYHKIVGGGYSTYSFDPQQRDLAYLKWDAPTSNKWFDKIRVITSFQNAIEGRIKQKTNDINIKNEKDKVKTFGGVLEVLSKPSKFWSISSGVEYYNDKVRSSTVESQENSDVKNEIRGLYLDNSTADNFALYSLHSFDTKKFNFSLGSRFNMIKLGLNDELFGQTTINPNAFVGNAGITYKVNSSYHIVGSINSGFRAPNISDVSSFGIADFRYEVPNYDLKPERSLNFEIGLKSRFQKFSSNIYFYQNNLTDLITNVRSIFNGQNTIEGVQVYKRINVDKAVLRGIETDVEYVITSKLTARANLTYTRGENQSKDEPMRRIPPLFGRMGVFWHLNSKIKINGNFIYASKQDRLSQGDIDDERIADGGTPSWKTFGLNAHYLRKNIHIQTGIINLFDEAYRTHGSGVDEIGRTVWASLKLIL